jgi:membrane protease YdiL (CAAX protease family)
VPDPVLPPFPSGPPPSQEASGDGSPADVATEAALPGAGAPRQRPALIDAWPWARPFQLSGGVERGQFHPLLMALLVFVGAFVVFNVVGIVVVVVGAFAGGGITDTQTFMEQNGGLALGANTLGQWVAFAGLAVLMARWSTAGWKPFLRWRRPDWGGFALAGVGWFVGYAFILWLGQVNSALPVPEFFREFESMQAEMLERLLIGAGLPTWMLFGAIAITPAVCEELMFRGYLQRQVERGTGLVWSIVLVGILFGAYHLQVTKVLPLAMLGVYLGFVVWATGSVWTGAMVHLLNNGLAVLAVAFVQNRPNLDMAAIESTAIPWYVGVVSGLLAVGVCFLIYNRRRSVVGGAADAVPAASPSSLDPSPHG